MPFPKLTIIDGDAQRDICVIDGQPYYCSSGNNSDMAGVWLPFEGFDLPISNLVPLYSKPYATGDANNIDTHFPLTTAVPLQAWASAQPGGLVHSEHYWGRYKNIKCLYTSCLLTTPADRIPVEIRDAVAHDVGVALEPSPSFRVEEHSQSTIRLKTITAEDVNQLNTILGQMGYQAPADPLVTPTPALQVPQAYIAYSQSEIQAAPIPPTAIALGESITARHVVPTPAPVVLPPLSVVTTTPANTSSSSCYTWCCGKKDEDKDPNDNNSSGPPIHNPMER